MGRWIRVNRRRRCPICGKPDWCTVSADGTVARCARIESDRPSPGSDGSAAWLHVLDAGPRAYRPIRPHPPPSPQSPPGFDDMLAAWQRKTTSTAMRCLGSRLGVSTGGLKRLDVAWAGPYRAWAFPMREEDGRIVGIQLRSETASKWSVPGSRQGLFVPDGRLGDLCDQVLVCEGPTDTAALLDLGFYAIGRPSCCSGGRILRRLLWRREAVIVADRDEPKRRPDGTWWCPGLTGAEQLAEQLAGKAREIRIIRPPWHKDVRQWLQAGATHAAVEAVISTARCWVRR